MNSLNVYVEIEGSQVLVGHIVGNNSADSYFEYDEASRNWFLPKGNATSND